MNAQAAVPDKLDLTKQPGQGYNIDIQDQNGVDVMAFDQTEYVTNYIRDNYDQVMVKIPKGKKAILKRVATQRNITDAKGRVSVNRMIIEAIETQYGIDLSKPE